MTQLGDALGLALRSMALGPPLELPISLLLIVPEYSLYQSVLVA